MIIVMIIVRHLYKSPGILQGRHEQFMKCDVHTLRLSVTLITSERLFNMWCFPFSPWALGFVLISQPCTDKTSGGGLLILQVVQHLPNEWVLPDATINLWAWKHYNDIMEICIGAWFPCAMGVNRLGGRPMHYQPRGQARLFHLIPLLHLLAPQFK